MFQIQRAIVLSLAFVSDGAFPVVAVHAVVVPPAAMISRYVTAKVAFELDVGLFVCLTIVDAKLVVLILTKKLALLPFN
jgi:fructose-specific phosphotransferase system IIC component